MVLLSAVPCYDPILLFFALLLRQQEYQRSRKTVLRFYEGRNCWLASCKGMGGWGLRTPGIVTGTTPGVQR